MKTALRIFAIVIALGAGLLLSVMLAFGGPNYYGLRPHAVKAGLDSHDLSDLTALAQYGPVSGIISYDAWYEGRNGLTGWFLLPIDQAEDLEFNVNGQLDPTLAAYFGAPPRRCKGTGLPEKMIRAVEPERNQSGFLGRSTCTRSKMDIRDIIAASSPAQRHETAMTHAELLAFDDRANPLMIRDNVRLWPTPYAYYRTITLPIIWQSQDRRPHFGISDLRQKATELAEHLNREGHVGVRMQMQEWYPRYFSDAEPHLLPLVRENKTVLITGIRFARLSFVVLCASNARADCDAVEVSQLRTDIDAVRDQRILQDALAGEQPLPDTNMVLRHVLHESDLEGSTILAPTSEERRFSVTWYDARATAPLK
ncbi:hypothetical protein [uncultured Sulfitobacter sp.]|uniref:hypothetical protein n=1 Tax=uncultured Sulfitobacter sp. TaxID=191468 RepID=UPI00260D1E0A|nr:hypothetical protein [uncultured Sulfitobacter sp.]